MRLLFFEWNAFMQNDVEKALEAMDDIQVDYVSYEFKNVDEDPLFVARFPEYLQKAPYDAVFSLNFFPLVSDLCAQYNIPYISWVYDAPMNVRRTESFANPVNKIYVFDRGQYEDLTRQGFTTVTHMPLGVNTAKIDSICLPGDEATYAADISFVGKLYENQYPQLLAALPPNIQTVLEKVVNEQLNTYGHYFLSEVISDNFARALGIGKPELEFLIANEVTKRERYNVLKTLAARYPVTLYSFNTPNIPGNLINKGTANYYTQMPKVFHYSKINLNITLKIIKTGMPLRVLDILGAGGFLMSNYQKELAENFVDGKEIAMYSSMDELVEKTAYYLSHEDERRQLAINGRKRAGELFELSTMLRKILL